MSVFNPPVIIKYLPLILMLPFYSHAASCVLGGKPKATTGALTLAVDPNVTIGEQLGIRFSKGFYGQTLVVGCTGTSPYRSASLLTASTTVDGAYETGIPGVGVMIGDLYKPGQNIPYMTSLSQNLLTPWINKSEVKLTFVKTGPITPGTTGSKVYSNYYLNSESFATLTVNSLTIIQKSCLADTSSKNQTVNLGSPTRSEFNGVGSTATSSERNFSVILQCESDNIPVQVTFEPVGSSDGEGMLTINDENDAASGVAVEVMDKNRTPLSFTTATTYHSAAEQRIEIPLIAHYKQTGEIAPGAANAAMTFTITQN
ncbi:MULTISPECIES: fimbrial protein [Erwinia]|uniref:Fimbrial protein n=1 Tax=Erwinia plantamica TaxID=3237104 RepID=A0ABW7CN64_9GAMM|nr:fimbrial protein [Erwinia sp. PsM31]MDN4627786.1 fimbrial protein [Erwinia sp. PsM31]